MTRNQDQYQQLASQEGNYLGQEIITGEGVALDMPPATAASRLVAGFIDWLIYGISLILTIYALANNSDLFSVAVFRALIIGDVALWIWLVPALVTGLSAGWSLGKLITGTKIVRSDGGVITMRHAIIRATAGIVEIWALQGTLAFVTMAVSRRAQRIGDMLADTYVVRWPRGRSYDLALAMPPTMTQWAQVAQVREIPGGLTLNITNHFKSAAKLTPQARLGEAQMLAAAAERYVSPAPAWGTPPEDFLAALLILRNKVEYERGQATRERHEHALATAQRLPY